MFNNAEILNQLSPEEVIAIGAAKQVCVYVGNIHHLLNIYNCCDNTDWDWVLSYYLKCYILNDLLHLTKSMAGNTTTLF